jgi:deazaflavin-dependent oxidoreductase (nitroreductase family)
MVRAFAKLVGVVALAIAAIAAVFFFGMRRKNPLVQDAIRRFNRDVTNPHAMETAGNPGAYASVIRHVGRTTGRLRETPVRAAGTDDGFLIALPYGTRADWLKNVLASGKATIVDNGTSYEVDRPEVIPLADVSSQFPAMDQKTLSRFGVDQCLRLRRVDASASEPEAEPQPQPQPQPQPEP